MIKRFTLGILAYLVPTFALGFVWHLILFQRYYDELAIYRKDIIIPFGFLSMLTQAIIFAWIYEKAFAQRSGSLLSRSLAYGALGAALSWSFTTLAVAAKNVMTSVPNYLRDRDCIHRCTVGDGGSADHVRSFKHRSKGAGYRLKGLNERIRTPHRGASEWVPNSCIVCALSSASPPAIQQQPSPLVKFGDKPSGCRPAKDFFEHTGYLPPVGFRGI